MTTGWFDQMPSARQGRRDFSVRKQIWETRPLVAAILVTGITASGCAHFQPKPIALDTNLAQIEARDLSSDALAQAVRPTNLFSSWPPPSWDLTALTAAALFYNPNLALARAQWDAARAGVVTAGQIPNPQVVTGPGYTANTPPNTITPWILNLNLDFTIETAGKRGYRIAQASNISQAARFSIATSAWQIRSQLRQAFLDLYSGSQSVGFLEHSQDIQERNVTLLQRQLTAGQISSFEFTQARLILDAIRLQLADAERLRREALSRLAAAIGISADALSGVVFDFGIFSQVPETLPDSGAQRVALINRADILTALSNYDASQSALQLEIARQYPDIHLGPGYQMDQNANKWSLLLTAVLPVFNQNRGPIEEAEARRTAAAAALDTAQARAIGEVQTSLSGFGAAVAKYETADQSVRDTRMQEMTARQRLAAGEIAEVDLGSVEIELATAELARFQALVQVQAAYGAIENAIQRPADLPFALAPPGDSAEGSDDPAKNRP